MNLNVDNVSSADILKFDPITEPCLRIIKLRFAYAFRERNSRDNLMKDNPPCSHRASYTDRDANNYRNNGLQIFYVAIEVAAQRLS